MHIVSNDWFLVVNHYLNIYCNSSTHFIIIIEVALVFVVNSLSHSNQAIVQFNVQIGFNYENFIKQFAASLDYRCQWTLVEKPMYLQENCVHRTIAPANIMKSIRMRMVKLLSLVLICTVFSHDLLIYHSATNAEENIEKPKVVVCQPPIDLTVAVDATWLETVVFGNFRIWHIIFSGIAILIGITVILCCLFRCRIPRTKQEIEADFIRKKITKSFRSHLNKVRLEELEYDPTNLLPVFKHVEVLEETRVNKHRSFERGKLTWKQKLKKLFTGKEISFDDEFGDRGGDSDGEKSDAKCKKMTKEEMEQVEKAVESAKIDSTAFNVINDQIAILSYFESDKSRKQRKKEMKKTEKLLKKEQKKLAKIEKKQQKMKTKSAAQDDKTKDLNGKILELKSENLEKDHDVYQKQKTKTEIQEKDSKVEVASVEIHSEENKVDDVEQKSLSDEETKKKILDQTSDDQQVIIPINEPIEQPSGPSTLNEKKSSKFSFRDTVNNLMSLKFRSNKNKSSDKPKLIVENKEVVREAMIINIEMVSKSSKTENEDNSSVDREYSNKKFIPIQKQTIPQIEYPSSDNSGSEIIAPIHQKSKLEKSKSKSIDRNHLQIPEITIKEINVDKQGTEGINIERRLQEKKLSNEKKKENKISKSSKLIKDPKVLSEFVQNEIMKKTHSPPFLGEASNETTGNIIEDSVKPRLKTKEKFKLAAKKIKNKRLEENAKPLDECDAKPMESITIPLPVEPVVMSFKNEVTDKESNRKKIKLKKSKTSILSESKDSKVSTECDEEKKPSKQSSTTTESCEHKFEDQSGSMSQNLIEENVFKDKKDKNRRKEKPDDKVEKKEKHEEKMRKKDKPEDKIKKKDKTDDKTKKKDKSEDKTKRKNISQDKCKELSFKTELVDAETFEQNQIKKDKIHKVTKIKSTEKTIEPSSSKVVKPVMDKQSVDYRSIDQSPGKKKHKKTKRKDEGEYEFNDNQVVLVEEADQLPCSSKMASKSSLLQEKKVKDNVSVKHVTINTKVQNQNFDKMVTKLNEELKERVEQRRRSTLKRSKTIEDGSSFSTALSGGGHTENRTVLPSSNRDEFKKRLSEVLLQKITIHGDEKVPIKSSSSISSMSKLKKNQISRPKMKFSLTHTTNSSSEIEIPVQHEYTHVHGDSVLQTPSNDSTDFALIVHPSLDQLAQYPVPSTSKMSQKGHLASPTRSIKTEYSNIVEKFVEAGPSGANRELKIERTRDVIINVPEVKKILQTSPKLQKVSKTEPDSQKETKQKKKTVKIVKIKKS